MSSPIKLILAGLFAVTLVYLLTSNAILQRVSYDIYECNNRLAGSAKIWFKKVRVGEKFEFTVNNKTNFLEIRDISDGKILFSDNKISYKLDLTKLRLIKEELGSVIFFTCELNAFRM